MPLEVAATLIFGATIVAFWAGYREGRFIRRVIDGDHD